MTIEELEQAIWQVVDYCWENEYSDAVENGVKGHVIEPLAKLAAFVGDPRELLVPRGPRPLNEEA